MKVLNIKRNSLLISTWPGRRHVVRHVVIILKLGGEMICLDSGSSLSLFLDMMGTAFLPAILVRAAFAFWSIHILFSSFDYNLLIFLKHF